MKSLLLAMIVAASVDAGSYWFSISVYNRVIHDYGHYGTCLRLPFGVRNATDIDSVTKLLERKLGKGNTVTVNSWQKLESCK